MSAFELFFLFTLIAAFIFTLRSLGKEDAEARRRLYKRAELIARKRIEGGLKWTKK